MTATQRLGLDYSRISDDSTKRAAGVTTQRKRNREVAADEGITLVGSYSDNDVSAYRGKRRDEYHAMVERMAQGDIRFIICWHPDRLHRSTLELENFIAVAKANRITVVTATAGTYRLWTAYGQKALKDATNEAEYESAHRGERVAEARERQALEGEYGGGGARPYGWGADTGRVRRVCLNPKAPARERRYEDRPVLDMTVHRPEEADEIRHWRDELLAGVSMAELLRDIKARGVATVSETDQRTLKRGGKTVEHGGWSNRSIKAILTSPRVSGHAVHQGEIVTRDVWDPIITEDERQQLIELFRDKDGYKGQRGNVPRWLLSLIARCGHPKCKDDPSAVMVVRYGNDTARYVCRARQNSSRLSEELDERVEALICERLSRPDAVDLLGDSDNAEQRAQLGKEADAVRRKISRLATLYEEEEIEIDEYKHRKREHEARLNAIKAKRAELAPNSPLADAPLGTVDIDAWWARQSLGRHREIVRYLLDIVIVPTGKRRPRPVREGENWFEVRNVRVTWKKKL